MSANLIDVDANAPATPAVNPVVTETTETVATLGESIQAVPQQAETTAAVEAPEPELPAKYKGKSISEVVEMHQNAEKLHGRQSAEVGELRNIVDDFIQHQSQSTQPNAVPTTPEVEEEIDLFDDPKASINKLIDNHPAVKKAQELEVTATQQKALDSLNQKHSDIPEVLADPKFLEWIEGSRYRTKALQEANTNYNVDAADDIFSEWKRVKPADAAATKSTDPVLADQKQQTKKASTGAIPGSAGDNRKLYRRTDLIKLKIDDPERYSLLQPEIMQAYAERRVV